MLTHYHHPPNHIACPLSRVKYKYVTAAQHHAQSNDSITAEDDFFAGLINSLCTLDCRNVHYIIVLSFFSEHFPYFKTAPSGWKNSVRHNLSLNKCFEKIEKPTANGSQRKGCLWAMNPAKITKMDEEVAKWSRKDPMGIKKGMLMPGTILINFKNRQITSRFKRGKYFVTKKQSF